MNELVKIYINKILHLQYYESKNKQKNGSYIEYHPSGTKKIVTQYLNDKLHGKCRIYDESENLLSISTYHDGLLNGEYKEYYTEHYFLKKNKKIQNYLNNMKHGKSVTYYKSGNINTIENYVLDKLQGEYTEYYDCNQKYKLKFRTKYYKNNKLHGEYIQYNHHQKPEIVANYRNNKLHGKYTEYTEYLSDNHPIVETNYFKGLKIGLEYLYDNNKIKKINYYVIELHGFYTEHNNYKIDRVFEYKPNDLLPTYYKNHELKCDGSITLTSKNVMSFNSYNELKHYMKTDHNIIDFVKSFNVMTSLL